MSTELFAKALIAAVWGILLGLLTFFQYRHENDPAWRPVRPRYVPYYAASVLPLYLLLMGGWALLHYGFRQAVPILVSDFASLLLELSVYFALLLLALPWLRRRISARTCTALWLLPNILYIVFTPVPVRSFAPRWTVYVPERIQWAFFALWAVGFAAVLSWKTAAHLLFRRCILRGASSVNDPQVLAAYRRAAEDVNLSAEKYTLLCSPQVTAPLSVGLFRRTTRILLPEREYSQQELALIFRHELIHISREDPWTKFFLVFCTAMCWFNPLMWAAMTRSAEDMERSCDETVLLGCDDGTRRRYADLLLSAAGDGRGFTTCLAANPKAMLYRLRAVVRPGVRASGAFAAGLLAFVLWLGGGALAFTYEEGIGRSRIFNGEDPGLWTLESVIAGDTEYTDGDETDLNSAKTWLLGLKMQTTPYSVVFPERERNIVFRFRGPGDMEYIWVTVYDGWLKVERFHPAGEQTFYRLPEGTNWVLLDGLFPSAPQVGLRLYNGAEDRYGHTLTPSVTDFILDGKTYMDRTLGPGEGVGLYGTEPTKVEFTFPLPPQKAPSLEFTDLNGGAPEPVPWRRGKRGCGPPSCRSGPAATPSGPSWRTRRGGSSKWNISSPSDGGDGGWE